MVATTAAGQQARNLELVSTVTVNPTPLNNGVPGELSDLWVAGNYAYVGRYENVDATSHFHLDVYDISVRPPAFYCTLEEGTFSGPSSLQSVEDPVVEGQYLYVAMQSGTTSGVGIHDLGASFLTAPACNAPVMAPGVPSAHDLFFYTHSNGARLLFACDFGSATPGVHILDATNPGAPVHIGVWYQPASDPLCFLTTAGTPNCAPHDAYVQRVGAQDLLVVADWNDGVWIVDVTDPTNPVNAAHFGYTWTTPDVNGDGTPDGCDVWGDDIASLPGGSYGHYTHDARITPNGQFLWTADEKNTGGHILIWDLQQVLTTCSAAAGFCAVDQISPVGEFRLPPQVRVPGSNVFQPNTVHQVRWADTGAFVYATWYESGLRILDASGSNATAPVEIGYFDSLLPDTDRCAENGIPAAQCTSALGNHILNRGFFGDWGVAWDDCYLYLTERGSSDNNGGSGVVGTAGSLPILRYTGGPTSPQPLRITKDPTFAGDLIASWGDVPFAAAFNAYRGTIPRSPAGGGLGTRLPGNVYDHTMIDLTTCNILGNSTPLVSQFTPQGTPCNNGLDDDGDTLVDCADLAGAEDCSTDQSCQPFAYYYLVTARSPCDLAAGREGNYGQDSFGVNRPAAIVTCP